MNQGRRQRGGGKSMRLENPKGYSCWEFWMLCRQAIQKKHVEEREGEYIQNDGIYGKAQSLFWVHYYWFNREDKVKRKKREKKGSHNSRTTTYFPLFCFPPLKLGCRRTPYHLALLPLVCHLQQFAKLLVLLLVRGEQIVHILFERAIIELSPFLDTFWHLGFQPFDVVFCAISNFKWLPCVQKEYPLKR